MDSRYYDDKYLNDRLSKLEGVVSTAPQRTKEQEENEVLKRENEMLKQRLQMASDPVRAEFEQSEEFRNAWLTNVVSYLYEINMAQWAQSPYAKKLDEWTSFKVEEIRTSRQQPPQKPTQPSVKNKSAQTAQADKEDS